MMTGTSVECAALWNEAPSTSTSSSTAALAADAAMSSWWSAVTFGSKRKIDTPDSDGTTIFSFHLFARPALLKMQGASNIHLSRMRVHASRPVKGAPPRRSHQPARLLIRDGRAEAEPLKWSGSSDLVAFMRADCLIVVPEDRESLNEGELVEVISLRD